MEETKTVYKVINKDNAQDIEDALNDGFKIDTSTGSLLNSLVVLFKNG